MADKKIDKVLYGPSITEVALGAVLGLIAGVLVACVYLVFKPALLVKEMPKEPVRGAIYFIPGSESNAKNRNWSAKQKQFIAGTSITVVEDELNAWAASAFAAPAPKAGAKPEDAKPGLDGIFNPGTPNFKITASNIQISLKCVLNWFGLTKEVTVLTTLHLLPSLAGPMASTLIDKKKAPDGIASAWAKLSDVTVEGGSLKLTMQ
jgi:hypothetical protein